MRTHLQSGEIGLWSIIEHGYKVPEETPDDEREFKKFQLNLRAIEKLYGALDEKMFGIIDGLG